MLGFSVNGIGHAKRSDINLQSTWNYLVFGASNTIFHSQPTHTTPFALRVFLGFSNSRRQRLRFGCSSKSIYSNMRVWWHQTKCDSNVLMCVCWMAWTEVKWMRSASTLGHFAWLYDTPTQPTTFFNLLFLSALTTLSLAHPPSLRCTRRL